MKKIVLIFLISFLSNFVWSQIVFNKIIEDTVAHITGSIIALDTGYVFLTGTNNADYIRCFAMTYVDNNGEKQWKRVYDSDTDEYWEGWDNCLKEDNNNYYISGSVYTIESELHVFIYQFDSLFNLNNTNVILQDTISKKSFNIFKTSSNHFFITGQIEGDEANLLLVKTDSVGNFIWKKSYGYRYEFGGQIIETSDNNILIGGGTYSFPVNANDQDWYLLKVDTAGSIIWEKGFGNGSINDGGTTGIIETQDSNYIACGAYPVFEAAMDSYYDGCLRKASKEGDLLWTKYYRTYSLYSTNITTMKDYINSIYEDSDGNIFSLSSTYDAKPFYRGALTKMNSDGNIIYRRIYFAIDEFSNVQYLTTMKPTYDKGFILAGYGNSYDWYDYNPPQQAWLVKTDSLGLDGLSNTEVPELNIDIEIPETVCKNDTIQVYAYIAGKSAPYTIEFSTGQVIDSIYYPPLFVPVEIGLSETSIEVGGIEYFSEIITEATLSNHEWGQCIAKPIEFYTPYYHGSYPIDITVTDVYGESKTITKIVNVNNCVDLIEQENVCPVKLYPNPAKDKVYVDIPQEIAAESAEIYNSAGQFIITVNVHNGLNVVDVSDFACGNYILKIITNNETFSLSFEKE